MRNSKSAYARTVPESLFWEPRGQKSDSPCMVLGGHMRNSKNQHMPIQCPNRFSGSYADRKAIPQCLGTGRAYAELKIGK